jgi:hypothetical protein
MCLAVVAVVAMSVVVEAVGKQEAEEEAYFYQAVECVFDKICSPGLYDIE